jgi:hypothetical protein
MKISRTAFFILFTLLAGSTFIMSCKSSSTSPAPANKSIQDTGSTFAMQELSNGSLDTIIYTVFATTKTNPNTSGGKAIGLNSLRLSNGGSSQTYWCYESDGDLSIYPNPSGDATSWLTLPFVSHNSISTNYIVGGSNPDTVKTSALWNSSGSYSVGGQTYPTDSVTVTVSSNMGSSSPPPVVYHYTYLPTLGIIAIENTEDGTVDRLISYTLQ